ncbi:MAG: DUF1849 family protein, partial [Proteobacteria bacterium]|nr:DUF1849 family protein [Pseudomonadota bacterium]
LVSGVGAPGAAEAAAGFLSHRAVYDLSLAKSRTNGSVTGASGRLEFEWADVCTGWTISQRTRVRMTTAEGQVFDFGWTLNALEGRDGRSYRFFIRRLNIDGSSEELRGKARLGEAGEGGVAAFSAPEPRELPLPKGTLFPTAHSLLLMEAARNGELPLWVTVFDGSGDTGLFGINAALSETLPAEAPSRFDSPLLRGQASWRLHLAYFGMDETVAEPEHEQALRLYANGVVDEMLLDYGDFVLRADLGTLEALPEIECKAE